MARPTKRTPAVESAICDALEAGASQRIAALAAGLAVSTLQAWLAEFPDFSDAVKKAQAKRQLESLARIRAAGAAGTWQADAWYLERAAPQEFGRAQRVEHAGLDAEPQDSEPQQLFVAWRDESERPKEVADDGQR